MADKYSDLSDNPNPAANGSLSGVPTPYDDDWAANGYYDPSARDPERADIDQGNVFDAGAGQYAAGERAASAYAAGALDAVSAERLSMGRLANAPSPTTDDYRRDAAFDDEALSPGERE